MNNPLVSVVMPAYKSAGFLDHAVRSALTQTYAELEIILVVEPSFDGTAHIAARLAREDRRVVPVYNEILLGPAESRNRGIALARGEYIAFLDADDLWMPEKLERQMEVMRTEDCSLCCTSYVFMSPSGKRMSRAHHVTGPVNFQDMLRENKIGLSTCLMRSGVAKAYRMNENFFHEDYVYWLSVLHDGHKAYGIDEPLMMYRISGRSRNKFLAARNRWLVYRGYMRMNIFESLYYWSCYAVSAMNKYVRGAVRLNPRAGSRL